MDRATVAIGRIADELGAGYSKGSRGKEATARTDICTFIRLDQAATHCGYAPQVEATGACAPGVADKIGVRQGGGAIKVGAAGPVAGRVAHKA